MHNLILWRIIDWIFTWATLVLQLKWSAVAFIASTYINSVGRSPSAIRNDSKVQSCYFMKDETYENTDLTIILREDVVHSLYKESIEKKGRKKNNNYSHTKPMLLAWFWIPQFELNFNNIWRGLLIHRQKMCHFLICLAFRSSQLLPGSWCW